MSTKFSATQLQLVQKDLDFCCDNEMNERSWLIIHQDRNSNQWSSQEFCLGGHTVWQSFIALMMASFIQPTMLKPLCNWLQKLFPL